MTRRKPSHRPPPRRSGESSAVGGSNKGRASSGSIASTSSASSLSSMSSPPSILPGQGPSPTQSPTTFTPPSGNRSIQRTSPASAAPFSPPPLVGPVAPVSSSGSGASTPLTVTSTLSVHAAAWYPPSARSPNSAATHTAPVFGSAPGSGASSVFGISSSRYISGKASGSGKSSQAVKSDSVPAGPVFPASPLTPPTASTSSADGVPQASREAHRASAGDSNGDRQRTLESLPQTRPPAGGGEDVVYEFVTVSDHIAANEDQLIGAMVGGGYWGADWPRGENGNKDAGGEECEGIGSETPDSADEWVDPHTGEPYDNKTPPETHFGGHAHSMTPMSFMDFDADASTAFDDDLYDSELEWIEQELEQHQARHADDPTLFW